MKQKIIEKQLDGLINAPKVNHHTHLMLKDVLIEVVAKTDADLLNMRMLKSDTEKVAGDSDLLNGHIRNLTRLRNYLYGTEAKYIDAATVRNICDQISTSVLLKD